MMSVEAVINKIPVISVKGKKSVFFSDIQYDSRCIKKDDAFVAIRGFNTDGHAFIQSAYNSGARVFFVEESIEIPDATVIRVSDTRQMLPNLSRLFFDFPDQKLKIVGITGTNGKTTTAYLLHSIFNEAHWKPGLITTIEYFDGTAFNRSERTTPESLDLLRLFRTMLDNGLKSAVIEVSSHALSLHRVDGIFFVAAVFTNLGRDHLDFHETIENYFLAKRQLFENFSEFQKVIVNLDDHHGKQILQKTKGEIFGYSMTDKNATVYYISHYSDTHGMQIRLGTPLGELNLQTKLIGEYNIYNIMAAATTAISLGINDNFIVEGIQNVTNIPGRCEKYLLQTGATVYLDYAHSPDALRKILYAIWSTHPKDLTVVFGAGGARDKGKRPEMGKAAEEYADKIILTNDNPRNEDPMDIINEILSGVSEKNQVRIIPDRREAILTALKESKSGDSILIAGKGHENYQEIKDQKLPFDDHQVIEEYLKVKRNNKN